MIPFPASPNVLTPTPLSLPIHTNSPSFSPRDIHDKVFSPCAGDFRSCLNAVDINKTLSSYQAPPSIAIADAFDFYNFRTNIISPQHFRRSINIALDTHFALLIPAHIRSHWCLLVAIRASTTVALYDSCASAQILRDLSRLLSTIGFSAAQNIPTFRQQAHTFECGLFVLLHVHLFCSYFSQSDRVIASLADLPSFPHEYVSLANWRTPLSRGTPLATLLQPPIGGATTDSQTDACLAAHSRFAARAASMLRCYALVANLLHLRITAPETLDTVSVDRVTQVPPGFPPGEQDSLECLEALIGGRSVLPFAITNFGHESPRVLPPGMTFILGAQFTGTVTNGHAYHGHWSLTSNLSDSIFCITLPCPALQFLGPGAPPVMPHLPRAAVSKFARSLRPGATIRVLYQFGTESGEWWDTVRDPYTTTIGTVVAFTHERCKSCELAQAVEPIVIAIPATGVKYLLCEECPLPDCLCVCSPISDPDEVASDADEFDLGEESNALIEHDFESGTIIVPSPPVPHQATDNEATSSLVTYRHNPYGQPAPQSSVRWIHDDEFQLLYTTMPDTQKISSASVKGNYLASALIYNGRPPHVPPLTWAKACTATRANHKRWLIIIRAMPADLVPLPIGTACTELIIRMARARHWAPSTVAKSFSEVAAALRSLSLYSNLTVSIDLRQETVFDDAMRQAQRLAQRIPARRINPMSAESFSTLLRRTTEPVLRAFLVLAWFGAARLGDLRQVSAHQIEFLDNNRVAIRYTRGKGALFRGPYTSTFAVAEEPLWRWLRTFVIANTPAESSSEMSRHLFNERTQQSLARDLKSIGLEARSVRKGRLLSLANAGLSDEQLMDISGHLRVATLHRYLDFRRPTQVVTTSGAGVNSSHRDTSPHMRVSSNVMGQHANTPHNGGQRYREPPTFFVSKPPSSFELGISDDGKPSSATISQWPLHVKNVSPMDTACVLHMADDAALKGATREALRFTSDRSCYVEQQYHPSDLPLVALSEQDIHILLANGKLEPHEGPIMGFVRGFTVPSKGRRRPIFEPSHNPKWVPQALRLPIAPPVTYPSRQERRTHHQFCALFDFSCYFDQIEISPTIRDLFVLRAFVRSAPALFRLTRMPMGSHVSPSVAQHLTWCLIPFPLTEQLQVRVDTMIDNVRFSGDNQKNVLAVANCFVERLRQANVSFNADETFFNPPTYVFLGEEYVSHPSSSCYYIRNSEKTITKLRAAYSLLLTNIDKSATTPAILTLRNFAALMGLVFFAMHTIGIPLHSIFHLMRATRAIHKTAAAEGWDSPFSFLAPAAVGDLRRVVSKLLENAAIPPQTTSRLPPVTYAFVDASATGWGGLIFAPNIVLSVQQKWQAPMQFSSHAEPLAASRLIHVMASKSFPTPYKIFTDHSPIPQAARDVRTSMKGFVCVGRYPRGAFRTHSGYEQSCRQIESYRNLNHYRGEGNQWYVCRPNGCRLNRFTTRLHGVMGGGLQH